METVDLESSGDLATVRLRRPEVRNALNEVLIAELTQTFRSLPPGVRVVILTGDGPAFCAGADAQWMQRSKSFSRQENERDASTLGGLLRTIDECPQVVVARVQGPALGGGAGLVAACDIAVADEGAQFGFPEVRLGLVPAVISTFVLPRIGARAARRYFVTGERFTAAQALSIGLVHEVVPAASLDAAVDRLSRDVLLGGPRAVGLAKKLIRDLGGLSRDRAIDETVRLISEIRTSPEAQEGLGAFLEKRKPRWP